MFTIKRIKTQRFNGASFPEGQWIKHWGINSEKSALVDHIVRSQKPRVIVETGTFEAQATYVMARAAHDNKNNCRIYTIDYDGDPTSDITHKEWKTLAKIRNENLKAIGAQFSNCRVVFVEGDSRDVIPSIVNRYGESHWDLFYQDSMHFFDGIMAEWKLMENWGSCGSIVIFDDLSLKDVVRFRKWFNATYKKDYEAAKVDDFSKQFVVQKRRLKRSLISKILRAS